MQKRIEFNENQDTPLYRPSHLEDLKLKAEHFEVPDLETRSQRHDIPHYWLQQDILHVKNIQYIFFYNITLTDDTIPQVKLFTHFLLKFNYQLLWEQQDQQAYINFPQILTQTELLPYIINMNRNIYNTGILPRLILHILNKKKLDHTFFVEQFETSDNRPFITSNISAESTSEEQTSNIELLYTRQHSVQSEQEDLDNLFQNPEPHQLHPLYPHLPQIPDIQQANPSKTATIQNVSEFSEETIQNTQSFPKTNDSNFIQVPTHNITQDETNNQNQENTLSTTQDNTSVLSKSHTNITQPSRTQASPRQNYDPPPIPHQVSTQIQTQNSPQQGSSVV